MALVHQPCSQQMRQCRIYTATSHVLLYVGRHCKVKALCITMNCHKCILSSKGLVVVWVRDVHQRFMYLNTWSPMREFVETLGGTALLEEVDELWLLIPSSHFLFFIHFLCVAKAWSASFFVLMPTAALSPSIWIPTLWNHNQNKLIFCELLLVMVFYHDNRKAQQ